MNLFPDLQKRYTAEQQSAPEAQRLAEYIAWGPAIFQASRLMLKFGILEMLRDSKTGMTISEVAERANISNYAAKVLLEASLSIGIVLVDPESDRFSISKAGWFLVTDHATRVNIDFNHDVNYRGWYYLEESLLNGKPEGLKTLGDWSTIYEGLSSLPKQVQDSWFGFDHFYSDSSFRQALEIVFRQPTRTLLDVGGNTGRWSLQCVHHNSDVEVTILDLPQQIGLMKENTKSDPDADRIHGIGINLLDREAEFPDTQFDAIWMSQFLDCFSEEEIVSILTRATKSMGPESRLYIMETFWDRQRYETASLCLTMTSLYFTALANGNSKMYHSDDMKRLVETSGLRIEKIDDYLGQGHSIIECKLNT